MPATSPVARTSRIALYVRLSFAAAFAGLFAAAASAGCGGTQCTAGTIMPGDDCDKACVAGGGLVQNGTCVAKCDPKDCLDGNTCVNNQCQLQCTSYMDCYLGTQDCLPAKEDGTGKSIFTCQSSNKAPFATPCPFGNECDALMACPNGDSCDYAQCNGGACTKDEAACAGVENCALGLCPDGKTTCTVPGCPKDQCVPMACITKGAADANAYCSLEDCHADADCPSSFYCGVTHDPHDICNPKDPSHEKGNNSFCGTTMDACIAPGDFTQDGHTYFEGSICLLRHTCLERQQCDPCDVDGQCANLPDASCVQVGQDKRCVVACGSDSDCQPDYKCDGGHCLPRYGSCVGKGNFCDPCKNDEDCGGKGTEKACIGASRNQKACFDFTRQSCTKDTDCPVGGDGNHFHCWAGEAAPGYVAKLDKNAGQLPEGVVLRGTAAYVGYAPTGEIVKIDLTTRKSSHYGAVPDLMGGSLGYVLGLAFDSAGALYAGVGSFNPAMLQAGIYKIPAGGGAATLFASDPAMTFPNGLVFDGTGNLYVADSAAGAIFKITNMGVVTNWLTDPSLAGNATNCTPTTPFPIGANGIIYRGTSLVVSNTNLGELISIPIDMGNAGTPTVLAGPDCNTLGGIDGIVANGSAILGAVNTQNKIVSISSTGAVTTLVSGAPLNGPASVAIADNSGYSQLIITNSDFFNGTDAPG
ncbi:MAG TPA: hypothetical protein VHB21_16045, partial [Minicystis sp.]|nr:hypothetical protein [Minicystis sp.]